jgi:mRNA interferase HigB
MRIIKRSVLHEFWSRHPQAEAPLRHWLEISSRASWRNLMDVRRAFPHADPVQVTSGNTVTVFNIGGNDFRLVVSIKYRWGIVYIRDFLTHAECDKNAWKARH